ncbi:uncharacterized protein L969DRAFT_67871 [Mixia osmundae IAM 14324]|uniref:SH3 domain-containing protein n=1 Tax=Mixia osmundae (strain CBS 9802 / IAM 14324 / JCM 22182 / KY 12970) TaxID=764103 RepID=G7DUK8_MIXOS|nr:uncharacterized protein L969DRAFT_67871 [Mixia osmundae IAM 14324]KEI36398.1 hypothetical protein L969DRAFT_67871 [Mixia osmundae IAM 14324]GAA94268.1 hypothetical protein E5Q_00917 [Mixia osmundae IAM 14324]
MKSIRRSLNKDKISTPTNFQTTASGAGAMQYSSFVPAGPQNQSAAARSAVPIASGQSRSLGASSGANMSAIVAGPPKMVVRSIRPYRARTPQEISFEEGDFFHVVGTGPDGSREGSLPGTADAEDWYDAANPSTGMRGLVPKSFFQVLARNERDQRTQPAQQQRPLQNARSMGNMRGGPAQQQETVPPMPSNPRASNSRRLSASGQPGKGPLYGVVQYDFKAERSDELDAKRGEPLIIIAQSNHEWFVAKPIGRLGGPGLIPVSFVEIQDMATGKAVDIDIVNEMIRGGALPPVEEWKKNTAEYKQSSIPLGRFDFNKSAPASNGSADSRTSTTLNSRAPGPSTSRQANSHYETSTAKLTPNEYAQNAYSHSSPNLGAQDAISRANSTTPNGLYTDQREPGRQSQQSSSRRSMPRDELTSAGFNQRYGLVTKAAVESFHFEEGSFWLHVRATFASGLSLVLYRLYEHFYDFQIALMNEFPVEAGRELPLHARPGDRPQRILPMMPGPTSQVDEIVCAQRVADLTIYLAELCQLPKYIRENALFFDFLSPRKGDVQVNQPSKASEPADGMSNGMEPTGSGRSSNGNGLTNGMSSMRISPQTTSAQPPRAIPSASSTASSRWTPPSTSTAHTSASSDPRSSHGRSGLVSAGSIPPVPQTNGRTSQPLAPLTASFLKIKVFHRNTDDLIAIRVPPDVNFVGLLDKIRDRLGDNVNRIRFREEAGMGVPPSGGQVLVAGGARLIELCDDDDFNWWTRSGCKYILYVD